MASVSGCEGLGQGLIHVIYLLSYPRPLSTSHITPIDYHLGGYSLQVPSSTCASVPGGRGSRYTISHYTYRPYKQIIEEEAKETVDFSDKFWLQAELVHGLDKAGEGVIEPVHNALVPQVKPMSVEQFVKKF